MAKLTINGKTVTVDDKFLQLSPEEQDATVEEISQSMGISGNVSPGIAERAASMSPKEQELARVTDNGELGDFLRSQAANARPGETPEQTDQRLYGKPMQGPSQGLSRVAGAADTLSWGLGDEMAAGIEAMTGGRSYSDALANQRKMAETAQAAHPGDYLGGQIYGAVLPAVLTMGSSSGPTGLGLGGRMLQSGKIAGAGGIVYGFNSGKDGLLERGKSAVKNGLLSTAVGLGSPVIGAAVGAGWKAVLNKLNASGLPAKAAETITDMLSKTGLTPQQAAQKLDELGPDAMLADLAQIEAAGAARASTGAGELMGERLAQRRAGGATRMGAALDDAFGAPQDPYLFREATSAAKSAISPAYEEALRNAPPLPKNLDDAIAQGLTFPAKGLSLENRTMMGRIMGQVDDALMADTPSEAASRLLDLRKSLDSQIAYDGRAIAMLSSADKASQGVLRQARGVVDDILKRHIPGVAEADAAHAPLSRQQAAFDFGRKEFLRGGTNAVTPAEAQARLARMTPVEQQMTGQGVRSELDRILSNTRRDPGATVDRITSRDWNGDKLQGLLGNDKSRQLTKAIETENLFTETSNLVEPSRGSRTAVLQGPSRWDSKSGGGLLGDMGAAFTGGWSGGGLVSGLLASGAVGAKRLAGTMFKAGKINEKLVAETADQLTKVGADAKTVVQGLLSIAATKQSNAAKARAASDLISGILTSQAKITSVNDSLVGAPYRSVRGLLQ